MDIRPEVLEPGEKIMLKLRSLYRRCGYRQYRMSKFDEYDLYARNKSFLVSNRVITFTDAGGRLLALKPDVTMSIVSNFRDEPGVTEKLCYNENVYRASGASGEFREIMQAGLECIGSVDLWAEGEVLMLAVQSLEAIGGRFVLDLSHMGLLPGLLEGLEAPEAEAITRLVTKKSLSGLNDRCQVLTGPAAAIPALVLDYLPLDEALTRLETLPLSGVARSAVSDLRGISDLLGRMGVSPERVKLDLSLVSDSDYYTGLVFKGFVDGAPEAVLSGGRYDGLMRRFDKKANAIGFAVYLDAAVRLERTEAVPDVDDLIIYDEDTDPQLLAEAVTKLRETGRSVRVQQGSAGDLRARRVLRAEKGGGALIETDA